MNACAIVFALASPHVLYVDRKSALALLEARWKPRLAKGAISVPTVNVPAYLSARTALQNVNTRGLYTSGGALFIVHRTAPNTEVIVSCLWPMCDKEQRYGMASGLVSWFAETAPGSTLVYTLLPDDDVTAFY